MSEHSGMVIHLGHNGHIAIRFTWSDDNGYSFEEEITVSASGEKPKMLRIERDSRCIYQRIGAPGEETNG